MALHTPPPSGSLPGFVEIVGHPFRHPLLDRNLSRAGTLDPEGPWEGISPGMLGS